MDPVRQIRFRGPSEALAPNLFSLCEEPSLPLAEGRVRVRCTHLSLDPYVRLRLRSLMAGSPIPGNVVGQVVESRCPELAEGVWVMGELAWASHVDARPEQLTVFEPHPEIPLHHYVGLLGLSGLTAFFGITEVCRPAPGERLVVSGASGGVGQVAVQVARAAGAQVLGIVSATHKADLLKEVGVESIVYRDADWAAGLDRWAPEGVHTYFDNVWGAVSEVVIPRLRPHGLIALCGQMSAYQSARVPPLDIDWYVILTRSLTLRGFRAVDYLERYAEARQRLAELYLAGQIRQRVEIVDSLDAAPAAFCRMFSGGTVGKTTVAIDRASAGR